VGESIEEVGKWLTSQIQIATPRRPVTVGTKSINGSTRSTSGFGRSTKAWAKRKEGRPTAQVRRVEAALLVLCLGRLVDVDARTSRNGAT
jgi:hypothetical protein